MKGFALWLASSRIRRIVFIAGLYPLPIIGLLSLAIVVMSVVLRGFREGVFDCLLAAALLAALAFVSGMDPATLGLKAVFDWSVSLGLGFVLSWSGSVAFAVQAAVVLALVAMIVFSLAVDDTGAFWIDTLTRLYADLAEMGVQVQADVAAQAELMTGVFFAGSLAGVVLALLLGGSWAWSVRDDDFGAQFRNLRLGYVLGGLAALAGVMGLAGISLGGALMVFGAAFMFQGMAVLAWWSRRLRWPRGWWVALLILPLLALNLLVIELALLSAVGFVDNWYGLRRPASDGNMV